MQVADHSPSPLRGILKVANLEPNATVFNKVVNGSPIKVTFSAKGHPGDTQRVPVQLAEDIDFLNALEHGVLEVVDGPEDLVADLQFETDRNRAERDRARAAQTEVLDRRQERDMIGSTCIGPAPAGREGRCGRGVIQNTKQQAEQPPLCASHATLSTRYYLAESGSKGEGAQGREGVIRREWREIEIAPARTIQ